MLGKVTIFESILAKIKSSIKNKNDMEEIHELVKLISVALYFDEKVTVKEFAQAELIIKEAFDNDTDFVSTLVKERLEQYRNEYWVFKKDSEFILKKILIDGNWEYAEYIVSIFKADGVSDKEDSTLKQLSKLIEQRKILLKDLGLA